MCERAIEDEPETLKYVPDRLKTEEVCKEAVRREPYTLRYVPDHLKTQEMCEEVAYVMPEEFLFPTALRLKRCALKSLG